MVASTMTEISLAGSCKSRILTGTNRCVYYPVFAPHDIRFAPPDLHSRIQPVLADNIAFSDMLSNPSHNFKFQAPPIGRLPRV
jgi:hypothetical protein